MPIVAYTENYGTWHLLVMWRYTVYMGLESLNNERSSYLKEHIEQLEIAGKKTDTIDVRPETLKDEVPILLAPGWASTIPVYQPLLKTLTGEGRRVFTLNHPQRGNDTHLSDEEQERLSAFPQPERQKASNLLELLKHKDISGDKKVDVIAHSEGCINAIAAALVEPEKFRNIVLFAPPGFMGKDSRIHLALGWSKWQLGGRKGMKSLEEIPISEEDKARAAAEGRVAIEYPAIPQTEESLETGKVAMTEGLKYMAANPLRAAKEVLDMPSVALDEVIQELRSRGIGIVIISGVDDPLFPTKRMAEYLKKDTIDGFLSVRGSHPQIGDDPERFGVAANQMLERLRDKKRARNSPSEIR